MFSKLPMQGNMWRASSVWWFLTLVAWRDIHAGIPETFTIGAADCEVSLSLGKKQFAPVSSNVKEVAMRSGNWSILWRRNKKQIRLQNIYIEATTMLAFCNHDSKQSIVKGPLKENIAISA